MQEVWKFYKEISWTNKYRNKGDIFTVSSLGNVKCNDEFYKCTISNGGYYYLFGIPLHRIIAEKFVPNPDNKPCIDHINAVKTDNRACNLQWTTYKENMNNPLTIKHLKQSNKLKAPVKSVLQYTKDDKLVAEYVSTCEAERQTKINHSHIVDCCNQKRKSAGGYIWKYKNI